jgi:uncharacterized repeat protein (TIGR03803 family)
LPDERCGSQNSETLKQKNNPIKLIKTLLLTICVLTALLAAPQARAGVAFTNLVFFTYTNAPNYGLNNGFSSHASALVQGNDGNFYGTTWTGGNNVNGNEGINTSGNGTIFKMTPNGAFTSLYSFGTVYDGSGEPLDGSHPAGNLIKGADGNLYGTTYYAGNNSGPSDTSAGIIFEITTNGALTTLYTFGHNLFYNTNADVNGWTTTDGGNPAAGLVQGTDGNFYGTTSGDGPGSGGTVFQFIPGSGLNTLYSFPSGHNPYWYTNGDMPLSELTQGPDGNFYGTTYWGGTNSLGTIFRITTNGTFTTLYSFGIPGYFGFIGASPFSPLLLGKDGNFYGAANCSGNSANGYGIIFKFTTNGAFTILHTFDLSDGSDPNGLIQGSDGNLYGTAGGGTYPNYAGTVFEITTNGTFTNLYFFSGPDGDGPGPLVQGTDGSFYGTTSLGGPLWYDPGSSSYGVLGYGTIFKITIPPTFQTITLTNGVASLTWSAMSNQVCQVQYSTNLVSTNWINLGNPITATNSQVSASDSSATDSQRFYRVMLAS